MWERLPPIEVLLFSLRARVPMRLSPLPTTALHGTLGHALAEIACPSASVRGCTHEGAQSCLYRRLFAPTQGDRGTAPPAIVVAPQMPYLHDECQLLLQEQCVDLRITLIGEEAISHRALVVAALRRVAERGIGIGQRCHRRASMDLVDLRTASIEPSLSANTLVLDFISPARIIYSGHAQQVLNPEVLWSSISRRAETLSLWYGQGPLLDETPGALVGLPAPFETKDSYVRSVRVRRYSSRQRKRMQWKGMMGVTTLHSPNLGALAPLLGLASQVQIGKATSFGLGRFHLTSLERDVARDEV